VAVVGEEIKLSEGSKDDAIDGGEGKKVLEGEVEGEQTKEEGEDDNEGEGWELKDDA